MRSPKCPDQVGDLALAEERIVERRIVPLEVAVGHGDVEPQHLAEQRRGILCVVERIVAAPAVTKADVEVAVGSELEVATVVVGERLGDEPVAVRPQQIEAGRGIGRHRVRCGSQEPSDDGMPRGVGEMYIQPAADGVVARERQSEKATLTAGGSARLQVEEVLREQLPVLDDPDTAPLFDDELDVGLRWVLNESYGKRETGEHDLGAELRPGWSDEYERRKNRRQNPAHSQHGVP